MKNLTTKNLTTEAKKVIETIIEKGMCKDVSRKVYDELCEKGLRNSLDLHFMKNTNTLYSDVFYM